MKETKSRLTVTEKKKIAIELAIKAGGKPILCETLMKNAKTIYSWIKR